MSLPPGFLDELRNRTSIAQVVGRKVAWDQRKSNQGKGDMWAPCPFHQEKSASFHVDDRKGYYYCFGCQAKGDAIGFVKETENVGFMEAVEILAREAGMNMPARDPEAQKKADRQTQLADVMELALQFFRLQLSTAAAADARAYLAKRGLNAKALERWEIGFAPNSWEALRSHLAGKGVPVDLIVAAGLAKTSDKGRAPYDVFRNRIIFPIRDARGRAIAFGGRAMDPNDNAKYLNSPETELFDKGRSLFNHGPAREAAGKGQPLIVAEGYMDVIALSEAGFTAAVAPLGTAVTETQLALLWRITPEPIVALDGDKAGLGAARRTMDLALPLLGAGKSLRFCLMPEGQDPDDLIRAEGAGAMQAQLEGAIPVVDLLWRRAIEGRSFDSPERKAALDRDLREATSKIADPELRRHYEDALKNLRWALFRPARSKNGKRSVSSPEAPLPTTKSSLLARAGGAVEETLRESVILATLIIHHGIIPRFIGELERLEFQNPDHRIIRDCLLADDGTDPSALEDTIKHRIGPEALENLFAPSHVRISPGLRNRSDSEIATLSVAEELAKLTARRGAAREVDEALEDVSDMMDEGTTWRLAQAAAARHGAERGGADEDKAEYDVAPNGAKLNRDERSAFDQLLGSIAFEKAGRRGNRGDG